FMMRSKTAIKSLAETGRSPSEIFSRANDALCEGNDADMFVTAWIGILDIDTGIMRCANAGHEYPALKRANGDWELFKDKHALALAAMEGMPFAEYEIKLEKGDRIFVYTDGVAEATDSKNELFGAERMIDALNNNKELAAQELLVAMKRDIDKFVGEAPQFDDITMLSVTYFGKEE
ncbi:MAG: serine/threonine-protein phosphatase, partial [Firmicutes bacterium]|nr:serine/threonine-protein phosphatase [Bacillota bacterium]